MSYERKNVYLAVATAVLLLWGFGAAAQEQYRGDVNHDGAINVLDVQATIGQVLGALSPSGEATSMTARASTWSTCRT